MQTRNNSIWNAGLAGTFPQYQNPQQRADTVIIGAGLTGLSAAYHLLAQSPGRKVVVLESSHIGAGASASSTGMLTPGIGQNLAGLIKRYGRDTALALYQESLEAVGYVQHLSEVGEIDCQLHMNGQLIVPAGPDGRRRLRSVYSTLSQLGLPCECLDTARAQTHAGFALSPDHQESDIAAIRLPDAGILNPGLLVKSLAQRVKDLGGKIYERSAVVGVTGKHMVTVFLANRSTLIADNIIVATSGYSNTLGVFKGRVLPVYLGVVASAPLQPDQLTSLGWQGRECVIDSRRMFNYFRLTDDNRIVFGGGLPRYYWGGKSRSNRSNSDLAKLARTFRMTFSGIEDISVTHKWHGRIGYVLDTLPTIRRLRKQPGVIFIGAWSGHGIALSIRSGVWAKAIIDDGAAPNDLPWFSHTPPLLPWEPLRWCSFKVAVSGMAALDRFSLSRFAKDRYFNRSHTKTSVCSLRQPAKRNS